MAAFDVTTLPAEVQSTAVWAAALLHALARDEAAGRRPPRLTEPRLATWSRFKGRLTSSDLLALIFEDEAVLHQIPFDGGALGGQLRPEHVPTELADQWLRDLGKTDLKAPAADYLVEQAKLLGLPLRMARSDLHVVKPHQKVLELPGTGGQLAHHLVSTHPGLTLQDNFTIACSSWQELTMVGVVALDVGAPHTNFATRVDAEGLRNDKHPLRQRSFDFVIGLDPAKGGQFKVQNELAIWFPHAKALLV
jgi:hypothetical protein